MCVPSEDTLSYDPLCGMPAVQISEQGIFSLLLGIDTKKSNGPDNIPNEFLKRYAEYLFLIFTASLREHVVPSDWLVAKVIPVYKSGNKHSVTNYRPISLTCTSCKIFEHILVSCMTSYFEANGLIYKHQHGFRRGL